MLFEKQSLAVMENEIVLSANRTLPLAAITAGNWLFKRISTTDFLLQIAFLLVTSGSRLPSTYSRNMSSINSFGLKHLQYTNSTLTRKLIVEIFGADHIGMPDLISSGQEILDVAQHILHNIF